MVIVSTIDQCLYGNKRFYETIYIFFLLKVESHVTQTGLKLSTGVQPSPKMLGTKPSTTPTKHIIGHKGLSLLLTRLGELLLKR